MSARTELAIEATGLVKRFPLRRGWKDALLHPLRRQTTLALAGVALRIARGELFGVLGPNGAGKTTLFRILSTLLLPDEGHVTVDGHDAVAAPHVVRRRLAPVLADERSLDWRLTARHNLELYAVLLEVPRRERLRRVGAVLDQVGLADTGTKIVGAFSSGMRQRLLIARALLAQPSILLLDEPTRSLDPVSARALRQFLRDEIIQRLGCTIVLATHSAEEAFGLCDRVAILDRGHVLASGPAAQLARQFGDERYVVWTTQPDHEAFRFLVASGSAESPRVLPDVEDGWVPVELVLRGGNAGSADVHRSLAERGVPIARFERSPLSLADLIERVVREGRTAPGAGGREPHG